MHIKMVVNSDCRHRRFYFNYTLHHNSGLGVITSCICLKRIKGKNIDPVFTIPIGLDLTYLVPRTICSNFDENQN